jgi:hypothetical protein
MSSANPVRVLIASFLEPELVEKISQVDERVEVLYEPGILPLPRYVADHHGPERTSRSSSWRTGDRSWLRQT